MKKLLYTLVFLLATGTLQAQEYMTIARARELALAKNEDIKIAETTIQKSKAEQKAARTNYLPSFSAIAYSLYLKDNYKRDMYLPTATPNLTTGKLDPNIMVNPSTGQPIIGADGNPIFNMYAYMPIDISLQGAYMAGVMVEQPLFTGGKIIAGNKMATIGVEMAEENLQLKKSNAIAEVDNAYWIYVSVQSKVKLAESSEYMLKNLLERVQNAYNAGLATRNDVLKVQVEYDKAILNLQKAKSGLAITRMSLCRVTGLAFDTQIVTDSIISIPADIALQLGNEKISNRPEYKLLEQKIFLEEQRIKTACAEFLPVAGISAGYIYTGGVKLNNEVNNQGNLGVMATLKIPLFSWGKGIQKISAAKTEKSIAEYEFQKNTDLMNLEVENAKLNLKDAVLKVQISETGLKQATENLKVSNDNYEVGRELLTDRLIAQTQWEKAYNEVIEAKTEFKLQETEYLRVTSKLNTVGN